MPLFGRIEVFNCEGEKWPEYLEQMEEYFVANGIDDVALRKSIFLASCGSQCYSILHNLTLPDKPRDSTFQQLTELLTKYFSPTPSEIVSRFKFYTRSRQDGESMAAYMAELRKLSMYCNYGNVLNDMLRDRLVCGVNNDKIQERLLAEPKLSLQKALDLATAMETATRDVIALQLKKISEKDLINDINKLPIIEGNKESEKQEKRQGGQQQIRCFRCDGSHFANKCKFFNMKCFSCGKMGHMAKVCRGREKTKRKDTHNVCTVPDEIYDMNKLSSDNEPPVNILVKIQDKAIQMELDSGATISVISETLFSKYWGKNKSIRLKPTPIRLRDYFGNIKKAIGEIEVEVEMKGKSLKLPLCIAPGQGPALFGRNWMKKFGILEKFYDINTLNKLKMESLEMILNKHKSVFSGGLGKLKSVMAKLIVPKDAKPKFFKSRLVPISMQEKIEKELDRLVEEGILIPVRHSNWAAPIVPIVKEDGSIRITGDFKITVNPVSKLEQYPVPRIEELFAKLSGGRIFSKLDLRDAYFQMELEESSREYVTINTQKGLYSYSRLPQGVSSAPAIFLRAMDGLLGDLKQVAIFFDDFLITGKDEQDHLKRLDIVLSRIEEAGLKIKKEKCIFMEKSIEYLGHRLDEKGLHPIHLKVEAIKAAPGPKNVKELQSFLGLLNHYRKFLPNLSTTLQPMYNLLKKGEKWKWNREHEDAFKECKDLLTSERVLSYFDPARPIIISCDASPYGVGAVLSQLHEDGTERPVSYVSRSLMMAEKNYAQLDREALALVFGVKRFHQYVYGYSFELRTDHKPLLGLFQSGRQIPTTSSPRIIRWATTLASYEYKLTYIEGKKNENADALSRLPLHTEPFEVPRPKEIFMLEKEYPQLLSPKSLAKFTNRDPILSVVREALWAGKEINSELHELKPYAHRQGELSVQENCVLWGSRIVIPQQLRHQVLELLHEGHPGISRMKTVARTHVWWPKLDEDLENKGKACGTCQANRRCPVKTPMNSWTAPDGPWSRIHVDHAGPFYGKLYLVVVDAYSKWIEVHIVPSLSSETTIIQLRRIFASQGLPDVVVSDNGTSFNSLEFRHFLKINGVRQILVPPYHPASNGAAERTVQTVKEKLKLLSKGDWETKLSRFLLHYRTQPHGTTGVSPAELLNNRKLKTLLTCLHPNMEKKVQEKQLLSKIHHDIKTKEKIFERGDPVFVKNFRGRPEWIPGIIEEKVGEKIYMIRVSNGTWRRHVDHIRTRMEKLENEVDEMMEPMPWTPIVTSIGEEPEGDLINLEPREKLDSMKRETPEILQDIGANQEPRRSSRIIRKPDRLDL